MFRLSVQSELELLVEFCSVDLDPGCQSFLSFFEERFVQTEEMLVAVFKSSLRLLLVCFVAFCCFSLSIGD